TGTPRPSSRFLRHRWPTRTRPPCDPSSPGRILARDRIESTPPRRSGSPTSDPGGDRGPRHRVPVPVTRPAPEVPISILAQLTNALRDGSVEVVDLTAPLSSETPLLELPPHFGQTAQFQLEE